MAATCAKQQHGGKGSRKNHHKRSFFCFSSWLGCCGGSSRVSADCPGDGNLTKYGRRNSCLWGKKSKGVISPSSPEIVSMSREIHVVEDKSQILAQPQLLNNNQTQGNIWDKDSKEMYKSDPLLNSPIQIMDTPNTLVQQGRSTPRMTKKNKIMPHSLSLPLLPLPLSLSLPSPRKNDKKFKHGKQIIGGDGSELSLPLPRKNDKKPKHEKQMEGDASELDSSVGAIIVTVTLIVMLICGKMCAILCAAAWLYYVPRLRSNIDVRANKNEVDFDSWDYKKRVVLQGLLQRN